MKKELRKNFLNQRRELSVEVWESLSVRISHKVLGLIQWLIDQDSDHGVRSMNIHCYMSVPKNREVNTHPLIQALWQSGHRVGIPKTDMMTKTMKTVLYTSPAQLQRAEFDLLEPSFGEEMPYETLDFVILPNVATDLRGGRLGYGMGFYDRFLSNKAFTKKNPSDLGMSLKPIVITPAFELSVSDQPLPSESTDVPSDWIVTEKRIIQTSTGKLIDLSL